MSHPVHERLQAAVDALAALERQVKARPGEVRLERDGDVAWILLDNPRAHNALTVSMMRGLAECVRDLTTWDGAVVGIASAHGGSFCAGGHLGQVRAHLVERGAARVMTDGMQTVLDALLDLDVLSVAVLQGAAIGGGVELASACDLRVGTPDSYLHAAQVRLGVACGWGGAQRLVRHLGRRTALRVLTRSEPIRASQALEVGLLDQVADGDRNTLLRAVLGPTLDHPAAAVRAVKRQVAGEEQADAFLSVWGAPAHIQAITPRS